MITRLSNPLWFLRASAGRVAATWVPQDCFVCGHECSGAPVCDACNAELPSLQTACPVCAVPTADALVCGRCLRDPPTYDATRAAFLYQFPVDRMVHALKYRHRLAIASYFTRALARLGVSHHADLILPMPLHPTRLRERGFNQAVEIARPLAREFALPLELARVERKATVAHQAELPWKARNANMRGAFSCTGNFDGQTIVVIDDVMTTGATLEALAVTLKRHGAARVENLVVARTPPP